MCNVQLTRIVIFPSLINDLQIRLADKIRGDSFVSDFSIDVIEVASSSPCSKDEMGESDSGDVEFPNFLENPDSSMDWLRMETRLAVGVGGFLGLSASVSENSSLKF